MSSVGTFTLIRNEASWIEAHLRSWLPHVDEMVFFDGNSTDGTLEILKRHTNGGQVKVFEGMDPKNLTDDYVRLFTDCIRALGTDYAIFAHPDMILDCPGNIRKLGSHIAYTTNMRSFAGEPEGQLFEIVEGRQPRWKNIFRLHNPDLGLHYAGAYGSVEEDCYFSEITGAEHKPHLKDFKTDFESYPYTIGDSGIRIFHYSDVRKKSRRLDRMAKCLVNQGFEDPMAEVLAAAHPRVTFKDGRGFKFVPAEYHSALKVPA